MTYDSGCEPTPIAFHSPQSLFILGQIPQSSGTGLPTVVHWPCWVFLSFPLTSQPHSTGMAEHKVPRCQSESKIKRTNDPYAAHPPVHRPGNGCCLTPAHFSSSVNVSTNGKLSVPAWALLKRYE
ncbi:unnamed protein product [Boreogadus saida]